MLSRLLHLEPLESRIAMDVGLTANLNAGVLAIAGTSGSDTISLSYNTTQVTLVELNQSFALSSITNIDITTGGGDDTVELQFSSPKKPKWIGVAMAIHAEGGNDQLIDVLDNTYYFGGLDDLLTITRKGDIRLSGSKLTWFDTNVADDNLRGLSSGGYADKVLSRDDMLSLFEAAIDDDLVTDAEYDSLQTIAGNRSLFRKLDYVYSLSNYVVDGIGLYDGPGILTPISQVAFLQVQPLETLVDKWFLGKAHPNSTDIDTGEHYAYREVAGTLFVDGPTFDDIRQGALGDCYLLAGLGALAVQSPKPITNMFVVNGDGTYTVRYFRENTPYFVTVDSQLPVDQWGRLVYAGVGHFYNDPNNELWVPLAEKAYAQLAEQGWLDTGGPPTNSYAAINAGWPSDAMTQTTGKEVIELLELNNPTDIIKSFASGRAITLITPGEPESTDIVEDHVYAMVGYNSRTREFALFNPWGLGNPEVPGLVYLTWDQVRENFYAWDFGPKA